MTWQPIDTAPKDGTKIDVAWIVNYPTVEDVRRTYWLGAEGRWFGSWTPTHWRPLTGSSGSGDHNAR